MGKVRYYFFVLVMGTGLLLAGRPYVLLISFDGFRADYLNWYHTPNFDRLATAGVKAYGLKPVFVSKTFPNHYSIVTGMYIENHGLVGNTFYDPVFRETFRIGDRSKVEDARFYGGEPIWVTAERQGIKTASYFWVGSAAAVGGVRPSIWKRYDHDFPFPARIDSVAAWFTLPQDIRPHLALLYFHEPDGTGHDYGPRAPETEKMVEAMDAVLGQVLDKMEALSIGDSLNIIVVADHGMAAISQERMISLDDYVNLNSVRTESSGPYMAIWGFSAWRQKRIYNKLKGIPHLQVYRKPDIPERWHYRNHYRIKDLLLVADEGWMVFPSAPDSLNDKGTHGYDNALRSMQAIFVAGGPAFKNGYQRSTFENVNIYPLIAHILGLEPYPHIDGDLEKVSDLLK